MISSNDLSTSIPSITWSGSDFFQRNVHASFLSDLPSNKFKKNDLVDFKFRGKILSGKITKLGKHGVDVKSGNGYYYCHDIDIAGTFQKSNHTKNYT